MPLTDRPTIAVGGGQGVLGKVKHKPRRIRHVLTFGTDRLACGSSTCKQSDCPRDLHRCKGDGPTAFRASWERLAGSGYCQPIGQQGSVRKCQQLLRYRSPYTRL